MLRDLRILKNQVLLIARSPGRLLLFVGLLIFFGRGLVFRDAVATPSQALETDMLYSDKMYAAFSIVSGLVLLLAGVAVVFTASSLKTTFFRNADVQFVFPSPASFRWVLLYHLLRRIFPSFFFALLSVSYFTFFLKGEEWISDGDGMVRAIFAITLAFFLIGPIQFLVFTWLTGGGAVHQKQRILRVGIFLIFLPLFIPGVGADSIKSFAKAVFVEGYFQYAPVIGWLQSAIMSAFPGAPFPYVPFTLLLGTVLVSPVLVFYAARDYYEDVLQATDQRSKREALMQDSEAGDELEFSWGLNIQSRKPLAEFGRGSVAFFWKAWLMNKRQNIHPLVGFSTWIYLVFGCLLVALEHFGELTFSQSRGVMIGVVISMLFLSLMAGIGRVRLGDMNRPVFLLAPGSTLERIFWITLMDQLQLVVGLVALMLPIIVIVPGLWPLLPSTLLGGISTYYIGFMVNLLLRLSVRYKWDRMLLRPLTFLILFPALFLPAVGLSWAMYGFTESYLGGFLGAGIVFALWLLFLWVMLADQLDSMEVPG